MRYRPEHKLETRRQMIESARRLFNRKGFAEVSIDEIMEKAANFGSRLAVWRGRRWKGRGHL